MRYLTTILLLIVTNLVVGQPASNNSHTNTFPAATTIDDVWPWGDTAAGGYVPAAPSGLQLEKTEPGMFTLTWTLSVDPLVSGYALLRTTTSGTQTVNDAIASFDPSFNKYEDTDLVASTTYYYTIVSTSTTSGVSPQSNEVSGTFIAEPAPPVATLADADGVWLATGPDAYVGGSDWAEITGSGAADMQDDFGSTQQKLWTTGGITYRLLDDVIVDGDFSSDANWTVSAGSSVTGGVLRRAEAAVRETWQDVTAALPDGDLSQGEQWAVTWDIVDYTSGYAEIAVNADIGPAQSSVGSYVAYVAINGNLDHFVGVNGTGFWDVDNVAAYQLSNGQGDYWWTEAPTTGRHISDSKILDLAATDDFAIEAYASFLDWSTGFQMIVGSYSAGDRQFGFFLNSGGGYHFAGSEDGTATTTINSSESIYVAMNSSNAEWTNFWRDGYQFPCFLRIEFDYDDGASQSRVRFGWSPDRGQLFPWHYSAWQNFGTGLFDFHTPTADLDIGHLDGGDDATMHLWQLIVYDEYTDYYDTASALDNALYTFYPWQHNSDGTTVGHATTLDITRDLTGFNEVGWPVLVSRDVGVFAGGFSLNYFLGAGAPYSEIEDRTIVVMARRTNASAGADIIDKDPAGSNAVTLEVSGTAGNINLDIDDGTNSLSTADLAFDRDEMQIFGLAVDSSNVYVHANGTTQTTSRGAVTGTFDDATIDLEFQYDQSQTVAIATFPQVFTDADFDGIETALNAALPGRPGDGDAGINWVGSSDPNIDPQNAQGTPVTDAPPEPGFYDTIQFIWIDGIGTDWQYDIDEIELFESVDGTGTNVALNADTNEATRATYPRVRASISRADDYQVGVISKANYMIDGSTATNFESALYTIASPTDNTAVNNTRIWVELASPVKVRSAIIRWNGNNGANRGLQIRASNRNNLGPGAVLYDDTISSGSTNYTLQNLQ